MHFCLFSKYFPFQLEIKISDLLFFYYYFVSPNSCVMILTVLKLVVHIKHTYIFMVKQTISTSWVVQRFSFLVGHNMEL